MLFFTHLALGQNSNKSNSIRISGTFLPANPIDTVELLVWNNYVYDIFGMVHVPHKTFTTIATNGKFSITAYNIKGGPVYIFLGHGKIPGGAILYKPIISPYQLAEPGDNIRIFVDGRNLNTNFFDFENLLFFVFLTSNQKKRDT